MLLPLTIGSPAIRQAPASRKQNPRCYGGLAAFRGITAMEEVAERETGHEWLFLGLSGANLVRTDTRTDDCVAGRRNPLIRPYK